MGSLLPANTFGGKGIELFEPVGGAEPDFDVIVQGTLTVSGNELTMPIGDLVMGLGTVKANDAEFQGPVSCSNLDATGIIHAASGTITGELQCGSLVVENGIEITQLVADSAEIYGNITTGGSLTAGGAFSAGNSVINGNLLVNGSLSVTAGLPIPETVCGIASVGAFGTGLIATVPYPAITSAGVVLLTPQTASAQIFNGIVFSVNVVAGVGFQIYASASAGGGLGIAWLIARL